MASPVLVGTVTLDVLHEGPIGAGRSPVTLRWGGVMNNMACAMGMRAADPTLVTAAYTGELAPAVSAHLAANQVRWSPVPVTARLPLFHAELRDGSVVNKLFLGDTALEALTPAVLTEHQRVFDHADIIVTGTDSDEVTVNWLADAAAVRDRPFWLLSADPTEVGKLRLEKRVPDLVALNLLELSRWAGRALTTRADIIEAAGELAAPTGRCLVTLGVDGAALVDSRSKEVVFEPAPVIADVPVAVGAGDVLLGCLLAARLTGADWGAALHEASVLTGAFLPESAVAENPYHVLRQHPDRRTAESVEAR